MKRKHAFFNLRSLNIMYLNLKLKPIKLGLYSLFSLVLVSLVACTNTTVDFPDDFETLATPWSQLGSGVTNTPPWLYTQQPSMAVNSDGHPTLAWSRWRPGYNNHHDIFVHQWTGSSWQKLGDYLDFNRSRPAEYPKVVLDNTNQPIVAWQEIVRISGQNVNHIFVKRWNGSSWEMLGNGFAGALPSIAFNQNNQPVIAYINSKVYVRYWNGSRWKRLGSALNSYGYANSPSLRIGTARNGSERTFVSFTEDPPSAPIQLVVKRWNGSSWVTMGNALNVNAENAYGSELALSKNARPYVVWREFASTSGSNVYVKTWQAGSWQSLGSSVNNVPAHISWQTITIADNHKAIVAWKKQSDPTPIYVSQYSAGSWKSYGKQPVTPAGHSTNLAANASGVFMAFVSSGDEIARDIYVLKR